MHPKEEFYDFEILIKSFMRFGKLCALIESIDRFYPGVTIRVVDDSPASEKRDEAWRRLGQRENTNLYFLPFNSGVCKGRNFLVSKATKPYFVLVDDDNEFTEHTDLGKLRAILKADRRCVIAGGGYLNCGISQHSYFGHAEQRGNEITRYQYGAYAPRRKVAGVVCIPCRITHNFFMANTYLFKQRNILWDERLRVREHVVFFLLLPEDLRVYYVPEVFVNHHHSRQKDPRPSVFDPDAEYLKFRFNERELHRYEELEHVKINLTPVSVYDKESRWAKIRRLLRLPGRIVLL
ncbi:MAG: glycosyltransferase [Candidatus Omnitrophica bacterium]|nr:glycosyltransferase [Candidatus Omnitrophota bacterium]